MYENLPQKKAIPGQHANETLDDYVNRTWKDRSIQAEFEDFETYRAYIRAEAACCVRIYNRQRNRTTAARTDRSVEDLTNDAARAGLMVGAKASFGDPLRRR